MGKITTGIGHSVSALAFMIAPPQLTVSGIITFLIGLVHPAGIIDDTKTILGFVHTHDVGAILLIVLHVVIVLFPLALAAGIITAMAVENELTIVNFIGVIVVAGIISNLLGLIIPSLAESSPDMWKLFQESAKTIKGPALFFVYAYKIVSIWWENFTIFPFLQSVGLGIFLGYRFAKR